ncbi:MAG: hypothetical protein RH917_17020 [Lacipirellulaceae bacterium]
MKIDLLRISSLLLRWSARIVGLLILAFVILHILGEGIPKELFSKPGEALLTLSFVTSLLGFAILWRWEFAGGLLVAIGISSFYLIHFKITGDLPGGWVFPSLLITGILALISWGLNRKLHKRMTHTSAQANKTSSENRLALEDYS